MYEEKLVTLCTMQRSMPTRAEAHHYGNQAYADYFERLAKYGGGFNLLPPEIAKLQAEGWDADRIAGLQDAVKLREEGHTGLPHEDLNRHLLRAGLKPHSRARWMLELALYRPYRDAFLEADAQLTRDKASPCAARTATPKAVNAAPDELSSIMPSSVEPPADRSVPEQWHSATPTQAAEMFIASTARLRGGEQRGGKRQEVQVGEQTLRQIRWAAFLLEASLPPGKPFRKVTHDDVVILDRSFDTLPITFGKSPSERLPIIRLTDIVDRTTDRVAQGDCSGEDVGLTVGTTNKHFNKLTQIHKFMRKQVSGLTEIDFSEFIHPIDADEREARARYKPEQGEARRYSSFLLGPDASVRRSA